MAYLSLYRKYRSQTFHDLIGQDHVVRTLQNGIASDRIAHSYLFTGPRGTGKTSCARLLAKALCCEKGPSTEPCNECQICLSITEGSCIDVVEMDAASQTSIDDVREKIIQVVEYMPAICRFKVFVIDEVHDLSPKAFDALLKTIEEPPAHMIFVLATTEFNKVPPTIRSRCQKYEFHRASIQHLVERLRHVSEAEAVDIEPGALYSIARMADGGFRDALTLLEQAIISSSGKITLHDVYDQLGLVAEEVTDDLLGAITGCDIPKLTSTLDELGRIGRDPKAILESMLYRVQDLTRIVFGVDAGDVVDSTRQAVGHELAARMGQHRLLHIRSALADALKVIRDISLPRLWLESELIRIAFSERAGGKQSPAPEVAHKAARSEKAVLAPKRMDPVVAIESPPSEEPGAVVVQNAVEPGTDPGSDLWRRALESLPSGVAIYRKLADSKVVSFEGSVLTVELARKIDLGWVLDPKNPGRKNHIANLLKEVGGPALVLELRASTDESKSEGPSAVELPAEGSRLAQIAREVFGS